MQKNKYREAKYDFIGKQKLNRFEFENGLRLYVYENPVAPVFSYQTWFDVGSRDEVEGYSGLAHLFEHMMFKGTVQRPQGVFDRTMESAGARDLNAFTSTDYTAYTQSLPIEALELVAQLESDRMVGLSLTKEQFESEREVVRNERKQRTDNNPEGQMFEELQKIAFRTHPYGRPVIGWEEDLDRMTVADCNAFYKKYYAPNNAVICVAGDVKPAKVAAIVGKHYGKIPRSQRDATQVKMEPDQTAERVSILSLPLQIEKAYLGYKVPEAASEDQLALSILSSVLSTGRSSRLYRALVDKGITIDAGTSAGSSKDKSLFYVSYTCQSGKRAEEALNIIDRELKLIRENGITNEELERVKNKLRMEIHMGLVTNSSLSHFIGQNELTLGDIRHGIAEIQKIQKVTAQEVQSVVEKYFIPTNRSVVIGRAQ